jgi:hypothetical protein
MFVLPLRDSCHFAFVAPGRRLMLSPSEGAYARTVKGSTSPMDMEGLMQLLHLLFTSPLELQAGEMDSLMVQVSTRWCQVTHQVPGHTLGARSHIMCQVTHHVPGHTSGARSHIRCQAMPGHTHQHLLLNIALARS